MQGEDGDDAQVGQLGLLSVEGSQPGAVAG